MVYNYLEGHNRTATKMQLDSLNLINTLFCEVNPIPIKSALNILGYNYGIPRLPLLPLSYDNTLNLENSIRAFGLI